MEREIGAAVFEILFWARAGRAFRHGIHLNCVLYSCMTRFVRAREARTVLETGRANRNKGVPTRLLAGGKEKSGGSITRRKVFSKRHIMS